jgi:hypothetical protein
MVGQLPVNTVLSRAPAGEQGRRVAAAKRRFQQKFNNKHRASVLANGFSFAPGILLEPSQCSGRIHVQSSKRLLEMQHR